MQPVDQEVDRLLTLLRNKIHERGYTQLDVQQALGWGRSYISQLLTKLKKIRLEQVLLILDIVGVDAAHFFAELYAPPPRGAVQPVPSSAGPGEDPRQEIPELTALSRSVVALLCEKRLITDEELAGAITAARLES